MKVNRQQQWKYDEPENRSRRLWPNRRLILTAVRGFTQPLARVGVIADTLIRQQFQAVTGAVTSRMDMTQRAMVLKIWWTRTGHVDKLSWQLNMRLINIFRLIRRFRVRQA